jgi:WXG100 family type VII secretion target
MSIQVEHAEFRTAVHDVAEAGAALRHARDRIDGEVDALLRDGWSGAAARSYADGWADWRAASDTVLEGLLAMGRLLDTFHADVTARDLDADASLDQISVRILERLEP